MNPWTIIILIGAAAGAVFTAIMIRAWHDAQKDKDNKIEDLKNSNHAKNHRNSYD